MAEVRICFDVDFEYCELGYIHAGRVLPHRSQLSLWWILGEIFWMAVLLPIATLLMIRATSLSGSMKWFVVGVLLLPWVH